MTLFRFKVYWEENTDVERIILIKSNQTFMDLYNCLVETFHLNNKDVSASFFTSDDYWDKHIEITLKPEDALQGEKLMSNTNIASMVEHPKQKFVFVYDEQLQLTFHIELIKIQSIGENKEAYPQVISAKNEIPKRKKTRQKNNLTTGTYLINPTASLSDDEIDNLIYSNLMSGNISEEDILNGNIDNILKSNLKSKNFSLPDEYEEDDDEIDEDNKFFDENNDFYDNDDFDESNYFATDDNDEN